MKLTAAITAAALAFAISPPAPSLAASTIDVPPIVNAKSQSPFTKSIKRKAREINRAKRTAKSDQPSIQAFGLPPLGHPPVFSPTISRDTDRVTVNKRNRGGGRKVGKGRYR